LWLELATTTTATARNQPRAVQFHQTTFTHSFTFTAMTTVTNFSTSLFIFYSCFRRVCCSNLFVILLHSLQQKQQHQLLLCDAISPLSKCNH